MSDQDREIGAYEAKTHLPALLDAIERGESFVITRRGKPVARLSGLLESREERRQRMDAIFREIEKIRQRVDPGLTWQELYNMRHEGHRY